MERPLFEGEDSMGLPETRPAQTIGELPAGEEQERALQAATQALASRLQASVHQRLSLDRPVHVALGLTRNQAKVHPEVAILLMQGRDLSLDLVPEYA